MDKESDRTYPDTCCVSKLFTKLQFSKTNSYVAIDASEKGEHSQNFGVFSMFGSQAFGRIFGITWNELNTWSEFDTITVKAKHTDDTFLTRDLREFQIVTRSQFHRAIIMLARVALPQQEVLACRKCSTFNLTLDESDDEEEEDLSSDDEEEGDDSKRKAVDEIDDERPLKNKRS